MLNVLRRKNIPIPSTFSPLSFSSNSIKNTNTNTILQILTNPKSNTNITTATSLTKQHLQNSNNPTNTCFSLFHALNSNHTTTPLSFEVLILALCQLSLIQEAHWVFNSLNPNLPPLRACNALLHSLVKMEKFDSVWEVYNNMVSRRFSPTVITYGILLNCCCNQGDLSNARKVFDEMLQRRIEPNVEVYTILIRVFCNDGEMGEAERVFKLLQRSESKLVYVPISMCNIKVQFHTNNLKQPKPNQTLKKYLECNHHTKVLLLFRTFLRKKSSTFNSIDSFSCLFALKACINKKHSSLQGKQLHALIMKLGYESIIQLQTSLLKVYAEGGNLVDAHQVFEEIPSKNIICWTSLISAYVGNHKPNKGLELFRLMLMNNVEPDQVVVTVALSACADTGGLEMGEWIHDFTRQKHGTKTDLCLTNALINMYAKCGDIVNARKLFDSTQNKDVTTWTSMIVGHAVHGQAHEALQLFSQMNTRRDITKSSSSKFIVSPNDVTFIGVLMACSHAGLVEEGKRHFRSMTEEYGIQPREPHFGCMVDLLCRGGHLRDAYNFIMEMSADPNAVIWRTLLGACSIHGDLELATEVRLKLLNLDPDYVGDSVAMSNIYAYRDMWNKKIIVRNQIKQSRTPGYSSIKAGRVTDQFLTSNDNILDISCS